MRAPSNGARVRVSRRSGRQTAWLTSSSLSSESDVGDAAERDSACRDCAEREFGDR